jgi:hypothetical protein
VVTDRDDVVTDRDDVVTDRDDVVPDRDDGCEIASMSTELSAGTVCLFLSQPPHGGTLVRI